jgi:SAM-dependent methyltransferase
MVGVPDQMWASGDLYEPYVGRWSRLVAERFLAWLQPRAGAWWMDVGCGTGALTSTLLAMPGPASVLAVDRSRSYLDHARQRLAANGIGLAVADAARLPAMNRSADYVVSGLVLNFLPDPAGAVAEMTRVCRPNGVVAAYVWDYVEGMQPIRLFWDAAVAIETAAVEMHEGRRFPLCQPDRLADLLDAAGLTEVESTAITVPTQFRDFADYWTPFLGGQGPAPAYCAGLSEDARRRLQDRLRSTLPGAGDGSISLSARAWAVRGTVQPVGPGAG